MRWLERLGQTDVKGGVAVVLAVIFVLVCTLAMVTPVPFKEEAAWVIAALLGGWLGFAVAGNVGKRLTDYNYAAIKQGTVVPPGTVPATPAPKDAPAETRPEPTPPPKQDDIAMDGG